MGLKLYLQVFLLRTAQIIGSLIDRYWIKPKVLGPAFSVKVPSSLSKRPGHIRLHFYLPHGHSRNGLAASSKKDLALIVNFHAGGFVIGNPVDDARWATALLNEVDAVFVSVGYRKGPEHPQPTAVEDCVDALRWLWAHHEEYGFDQSRTVISGFSAGGQLAFAVPLRHFRERMAEKTAGAGAQDGKLTGIVAFYPSVNRMIPREQKVESNPISRTKNPEPEWLHEMIDKSYYRDLPPEGLASLDISPALAPDDHLKNGLPVRIAIITCEYDKLLVEGEDFRKKLQGLGKIVGGQLISGVQHGFDKKPGKAPEKRDEMYREAIKQLKSMV